MWQQLEWTNAKVSFSLCYSRVWVCKKPTVIGSMKAKTNIIAFSHFHSMFVKFGRLNCGAHISRCLISKCRWCGVTVRRISAIVRSIFILFQTDNSHRFCVFLYGASIFFNLWNSIDKCMPSKNAVKYANKNEYTC